MKIFFSTLIIGLVALINLPLHAITGEEILHKVDANMNYQTIEYTGTLEIYVGEDKPRIKMMKAYGVSDKKAYVEFLNKEDSRTKYLKIGKQLWIHDGEENNTFLISGHLLKQGMMGSDVSYEDALESDSLYQKYSIELTGEEKIGDRDCYVVTLTAKVKEVPYEVRKEWIDKERFIGLKEEMYAKSGKLLKVSSTLEVKQFGDRYFPVKTEISDKLREKSKTIFNFTDVKFNIPIAENMFTMRYLER